MKKVISLSTIPPRFERIQPVLQSLLRQKERIDEIRLYIPKRYRRFPDYDGSIPTFPDGVTVFRPELDLGPASKILFCAADLRGTEAQILFCDDDCLLYPDWARGLFAAQSERPDHCVALLGVHISRYGFQQANLPQPRALIDLQRRGLSYRMRRAGAFLRALVDRDAMPKAARRPTVRSGYVDIFWGVGGVVVRPDFFDPDALDIPPILWSVDDVWLSGMLRRKGVPLWVPENLPRPLKTDIAAASSLVGTTIDGFARGPANRLCIEHFQMNYGIWT